MTRRILVAGVVLSLTLTGPVRLGAQKIVPAAAVPADPDDQTVLHVLNRLGYGPRPGDIARVKALGLAAYIDGQLHPERIDDAVTDAALAVFPTLTMSTAELAEQYYRPLAELRRDAQEKTARAAAAGGTAAGSPAAMPEADRKRSSGAREIRQGAASVLQNLTQARLVRAVTSERQLNEVLVDFWFNHFNVYAQKGAVNEYLNEYERDAIRPFVLGRFRDLLGAVAHSPAMLFYLDNFQSADPKMAGRLNNPRAQTLPRLAPLKQNMPRGLNENYARELLELHTLGVDGGYTQRDVQEVARVFTGWTIDQPRGGGRFVFRPVMHDPGSKTVLGQTIHGHGGVDGMREGEQVLDRLAMHPSTARHLAWKLAQRFVADAPPPSLVDRGATVYLATGGDLRETTRAILTSPEFFSIESYRATVKTPLDFVVSATRATGATVVVAAPLAQALRTTLGMPLYGCQPPTGYRTTADAWINTGALLARMNVGLQLASNAQPRAIRVPMATLAPDTSDATRRRLVADWLAGDVSPATAATLARARSAPQLVALLLGSPEFQKR